MSQEIGKTIIISKPQRELGALKVRQPLPFQIGRS